MRTADGKDRKQVAKQEAKETKKQKNSMKKIITTRMHTIMLALTMKTASFTVQ